MDKTLLLNFDPLKAEQDGVDVVAAVFDFVTAFPAVIRAGFWFLLEELGIGAAVLCFWKVTHHNVTTEIIFRGRAFPGPRMHDGFIQGRTLSTKALLLSVEMVGPR